MVYRRGRKRAMRSRRRFRIRRRATIKRSVNQVGQIFKLKSVYQVNSDVLGNVNTTVQPSVVHTWTDFSSLQTLYDQYAVIAIKKELRPYRVGDESSTVGATLRGNIVSYIDMDGGALAPTVADAVQYNSMKFHGGRNYIKRYLKIPKKYRGKLNDMAGSGVFDSGNNNDSTIAIIGDQFGNSQTQYYCIDTAYIVCYGRR